MLTPIILISDDLDTTTATPTVQPLKTYRLDFETGEVYSDFVDGKEAIKQNIIKAIKTARKRFLAYSFDYGSELFYLLGKSYTLEYLKIEIPRLITETLMVDSTIQGTQNFILDKVGDELNISFEVITDGGETVTVEVAV